MRPLPERLMPARDMDSHVFVLGRGGHAAGSHERRQE
jgi:hypothetical protein